MKNFILFILVITSMLYVNAVYGSEIKLEKSWTNMSKVQRDSIRKSYTSGLDYSLGYTLAAINWQESVGGVYQISMDGNDYGIYHINIHWYLKAVHKKDTMWNRSKYATVLLTKPKYSEIYVISVLQNHLLSNGNNFYRTWWRYNGAKKYADAIRKKVIFLQKIIK